MGMPDSKIVERLQELGVTRSEIVRMARRGQLAQVHCEMPTCYCHKGRSWFASRSIPMTDWALNADHYPKLKQDGGTLTPGNIRLAHVLCNREDYQWRSKIRAKLDQGMSLADIAQDLNDRKVRAPHGSGKWTAKTVRRAYIS